MKKIFLWILVIISIILWNTSAVNSEAVCTWLDSKWKLCSVDYEIDTTSLFWTTTNIKKGTAKLTIEEFLKVTANKLLIAFWVLALFIMTIGWGYMIFAAGQDELLNKWKSIFNSGLIALLVALGSWIIMKLVIYLLYP